MKRMKEISKRSIWKLLGVVLLASATVCGSLWLLRSEIRQHTVGESVERFAAFAEEANALLNGYGLDTTKDATVTVEEPATEESGEVAMGVCIPLEEGYQLYYRLENSDWWHEEISCMLISPLKDSVMETVIELDDERFVPFFAVAENLSNTYSAKQFQTRARIQQRRLFRYAKDNPQKVEGAYKGDDPETLFVASGRYEHQGFTCVFKENSRSYALGVWVDVCCGIYKYKTQYYSTVEITSDLNRP